MKDFNVLFSSSNVPISFTVDMDGGSDVSVLIDFGNGNTDSYTHSGEWGAAHVFTNTYLAGGRFDVVASVSNAEGRNLLMKLFLFFLCFYVFSMCRA